MNLKETDLNLFIAFDVIYTEKNLTKAGQVLGITQPAVSNALSRLRELFDDELFIDCNDNVDFSLDDELFIDCNDYLVFSSSSSLVLCYTLLF